MEHSVFVVEDDQPIGDVLEELLKEEGYKVVMAKNGQEALTLLRESTGGLPSLILLDLMMPVMDGVEFRKEQLKDPALAKIPVVVMSADRNIDHKLEQMSGNDYIRKPLSIDLLLEVVSKYCNRLTTV